MFAPGRGLADYRAAELYIVRLERDRDRLTEELALAEIEREEARVVYVEKHKAREAIEKIKERRQAEYYRLAEREETKALDDLAQAPAASRRRDSGTWQASEGPECSGASSFSWRSSSPS